MSSIWTPSGDHPIEPERPSGSGSPVGTPHPGGIGGPEHAAGGDDFSTEELEELSRVAAEMRATPVIDVVANHAIGLFQVGLLHLGLGVPDDFGSGPDLESARLAIDTMGAIVEGLGPRLGHHREPLEQGLAQARLLCVQVGQMLDEAAAGDDSDA